MNTTKRRALLASAVALGLLLAACGDDSDSTDTTAAGGGDTTAAAGGGGEAPAGELVVTGSSTVEPISAKIAEAFGEANPDVAISVSGPGTGDGFEQFCNGEADISDASRPIKEEEAQKCADNGIEFIELKVAVDGLSVITSANNGAVECLSFKDLYALLGPESTGFGSWADADDLAGELGGAADLAEADFGAVTAPYPDAPLTVTAPGEESGTYDSFTELVLGDIAEARGQEPVARPDYTASPNDNVIIEGIGGNDTSLGWVGFAFVEENLDTVKPLQVDGGGGCVEPTPDSIASGEYPIARDLFIYVDKAKADENAALAGYVDFYLSDDGIGANGVLGTDEGQVPYVPVTTEDLDAVRGVWEARQTGTSQG